MDLRKLAIYFAAVTLLYACDDVLEVKKTNEIEEDTLWTIPDMAEGVLVHTYTVMPNRADSYDGNFLDAATDNAVTGILGSSVSRLGAGDISPTNNPLDVWSECYTQLQYINLFLENGLSDHLKYSEKEDENEAYIENLKAEAQYLRAWWSFRLLQHYGGRTDDGEVLGYPIVSAFVTPEMAGQLKNIYRDTYEDCIAHIIADCDSASLVLPEVETGPRIGRATKTQAEFLKARALLYAASPAFQPSSVIRINDMGDYTVLDQSVIQAKWEEAAQQAYEVMNLSQFGSFYALKNSDLADASATTPSEFVMRFYFEANGMEERHFPPYYYGQARTQPSQNLVDAYPLKSTGYPIGHPSVVYDPQDPYADRDDRFELTYYYQGKTFATDDGTIDVIYGHKDSESFESAGYSGSRTGYYIAKFMSKLDNMLYPMEKQTSIHYYAPMRKAEIFLSFAEASNEAWGPTGYGPGMTVSAYDIIKEIRQKSGGIVTDLYIDEIAGDKDAFRELIQNERRLELAFENHRFWDMRRWLMKLDVEVTGIEVDKDASGNLTYTPKNVEKRELGDIKYYYMPLPNSEILKSPGTMVNNMGY
ncbi:MAG: RagB/SusD family nutrient uptake outer membrane protein [Alistipes sp.]|nr:RagB/SusD family nutrient uptake outer membrane protein [Alistipes sp.]